MKISCLCPCLGVLLLASGCATPHPDALSLDPAARAEKFEARSLQDPKLRAFLQENLGRVPENEWDFDALNWAAFYFHPALAAARAQWATSHASQLTASQRPNPTLVLTPGYNSTRVPGLDPWLPGVSLDFPIQTTDKRARQQAIARLESEAARLSLVSVAWQVRTELRRTLAQLMIASRRADLLRAQADTQREILGLLEQRLKVGSIPASEVTASRALSLRADAAAADAITQSELARSRVAAAIGVPASALAHVNFAPLSTPAEMDAAQLATARREALRSRSDVLTALAKFASAQAALDLEYAKQTPDFHLGPGYLWDQNANKWTLSISFELPIFNHNEGPIAEATARRAEAAAQFDLVQSQAIAAIDSAVASERAARQQLARAEQLKATLQNQETQTRRRAQLGSADRVEVETSNLDVSAADLTVLEAENALTVAAGDLESALQIPFSRIGSLTNEEPKAISLTP